MRGDLQDVTVQSQVADVKIDIDGTPAKLGVVELDRARTHVIHAEAPGYDPLELIVYPQLNDDWMFAEQCTMWPILWLPMAIDYNSGALNDFPSPIDIALTKSKTTAQADGTSVTETREVKLVIKKPAAELTSVRQSRTARMDLQDGY
jgi:hypothetical protein